MDLFRVNCVRLLLGACADTLEGLRLYPTVPYIEELSRGGAVTSELKPTTHSELSSRRDFDLSRNSSLRTLETTANSITTAGDAASGFLKTVLSTIISPLPLDVLIGYGTFVVRCHMPCYVRVWDISPSERAAEVLLHLERLKVLSGVYMVREFRLVRCADVSDRDAEDVTRALESIVEAARMNGGVDYLPCEPLIISEMRYPRTRPTDARVGAGDGQVAITCAL